MEALEISYALTLVSTHTINDEVQYRRDREKTYESLQILVEASTTFGSPCFAHQ